MQVNLPGTSVVGSSSQPTTIKEAAQQLESLFIGQLMAAMRRTAPQGGAIKTSGGEEIFRQMFDQEIAQRISQRGGVGIGEMLNQQLSVQKVGPSGAGEEPNAS